MNAPIRLKDPSVSSKQYTFSLGFGGMAALVTVFTLALCLFFVLGVLVGRGHRPETAVPVVAGIMPKESLTRQFKKPFDMEGVELDFREDGLRAIAERALARKTGARGLRSILESVLLETMYEIPSERDVTKVVIDESVIRGDSAPLKVYETIQSKAAPGE